jgi:hypothetical protein
LDISQVNWYFYFLVILNSRRLSKFC